MSNEKPREVDVLAATPNTGIDDALELIKTIRDTHVHLHGNIDKAHISTWVDRGKRYIRITK